MLIHSLCPSVKESSIVMGSCRPLQDISECGNDNSLEPAENIAEVSYSQSGLFSISHRSKKATKRKALHNAFDQACSLFCEPSLSHIPDPAGSNENLETTISPSKALRRKRMDRTPSNNNGILSTSASDYSFLANASSNVKNERLSPSTAENSSGSHGVTPSSNTHNDTISSADPMALVGRDCSNYIRKLAAKYNNANPNEYFSRVRNGLPLSINHRAKPPFSPLSFPAPLMPSLPLPTSTKEADVAARKPEFPSLINPFLGSPPIISAFIDMSTTNRLLSMAKLARETEMQELFKCIKRPEPSGPMDLSSAAPVPKRARSNTVSMSMSSSSIGTPPSVPKTPESPSLQEDISGWSVEDVANFLTGIDICAEYAPMFREQQIDGSGLPLLTEEHLTQTLGMKLGPALKLRSILAKKLGNYTKYCSSCHSNAINDIESPPRNGEISPDSAPSR
ncbi:lethal(3)malignant brain tumor-like protein 3 isoform X2 [Dendroctonus ponderosae]|uniref:lethal(3)malignant brain tumor-like protein 3 isoform X2 n=1 Tax=Dendroctonus ponderosae TaxID=77166 RepID=UPI002034F59F|nr:lethal(3)malignant brain tumor-like protein 3 isoform X2 [Dendroctonus ponderosae]